jgi:hypothetical protein
MRLVASMVVLVLASGCATTPKLVLERADRHAREDDLAGALQLYDRVAARKDSRAQDQLQALLDGAEVCDRMKNPEGARARLERGITIDAPGLTEKAMYYLAEHVKDSDHARALNLYYRAAAGAERNGRGFPYKAAMDRIIQLGMSEQ